MEEEQEENTLPMATQNMEHDLPTPDAQLELPVQVQHSRISENSIRDRVFRRRRFCMFRFMHNRIIERTYQRRKKKTMTEAPLTTEGLRRIPRLLALNEGHKPQQAQGDGTPQIQSASQA